MIDSYSFGKMIVNGQDYTSDLIIFPDRINDSWWRKQGHLLQIDDLQEVLSEKPDVFIVGTGYMGVMRVPRELRRQLKENNITLFVENSKRAVKHFNAIEKTDSKVIGAFHLTC